MSKAELVFVPTPGAGHIVSAVQLAKLLTDRDERLSITVFLMKPPFESKAGGYTEDSSFPSTRIKFVHVSDDGHASFEPINFFSSMIETAKPHIKEVVTKLISESESSHDDSPKLAGFVLDMFCTSLIDMANEFGVPSYIYFTSGAGFLGLMLNLQALHDEQGLDPTELKDSDAALGLPSLRNPLPAKVLPTSVLHKDLFQRMLVMTRRFREAKGIIVNAFSELESHAINSLADGKTPPVYPVGPILNLKGSGHDHGGGSSSSTNLKEIMQWLDEQPPCSVVFLCFGSMGCFDEEQIKEIARALENSGHRFLWSLRKPPPKDKMVPPTEYSDAQEMDSWTGPPSLGRLLVDVLAHPSVGGFVSHCGWNSTLESILFGAPIATWPLYAEQQFNAFQLVVELGLAVEIRMDYRKDWFADEPFIVTADEIERGIRCVMDRDNERIRLLSEMSHKSKRALTDGGSSYVTMGRLIQDIMDSFVRDVKMGKAELVFIPTPFAGHIKSAMELARLLTHRDERLSITILLMKLPFDSSSYANESISSSRIKLVHLPTDHHHGLDHDSVNPRKFLSSMNEIAKPHVREVVSELVIVSHSESSSQDDSLPKLAGFVLDMLCTPMIDVANEFGVPSYIFFPSGGAYLGLMFHLQSLHDEQGLDPTTEFKDSDSELTLSSLVNPLPAKVLPSLVFHKEWFQSMLDRTRRFRETKGIIVNTFSELEPHAIHSLAGGGSIPPVYPVGPILDLQRNGGDGCEEIMQWLGDQPPSSVVFLCFGSAGSFDVEQVKEIAAALEQSGLRFLWSLRKPARKDKMGQPTEYSSPEEVLPDGFLERTAKTGKIIGWAPQIEVLAHPSIAGFVSHCGWNSILESIWFGVPVAAWPLYGEQQFNAFEVVKELGLAVEIRMDYKKDRFTDPQFIVTADEIERGIRCLLDRDPERIELLHEISKKSNKALMEGGSSYASMGRLIQNIMDGMT
ncbi:hypothetical protein Tsubulata_050530, partial [Turnera subulata]